MSHWTEDDSAGLKQVEDVFCCETCCCSGSRDRSPLRTEQRDEGLDVSRVMSRSEGVDARTGEDIRLPVVTVTPTKTASCRVVAHQSRGCQPPARVIIYITALQRKHNRCRRWKNQTPENNRSNMFLSLLQQRGRTATGEGTKPVETQQLLLLLRSLTSTCRTLWSCHRSVSQDPSDLLSVRPELELELASSARSRSSFRYKSADESGELHLLVRVHENNSVLQVENNVAESSPFVTHLKKQQDIEESPRLSEITSSSSTCQLLFFILSVRDLTCAEQRRYRTRLLAKRKKRRKSKKRKKGRKRKKRKKRKKRMKRKKRRKKRRKRRKLSRETMKPEGGKIGPHVAVVLNVAGRQGRGGRAEREEEEGRGDSSRVTGVHQASRKQPAARGFHQKRREHFVIGKADEGASQRETLSCSVKASQLGPCLIA
ncbi:unnamed protein product [Pleuronectes platessa]|uniref:Uncharacterized protein n=1 Tax=Pleuronectes platessa TaxID=8262 RepID=A0A9N7YS42_PLEPL|nr:unnamed protein product [Pleuronectes platessa]